MTILKASGSAELSFLLPATLGHKNAAAQVPPMGYASIAREATMASDPATDLAAAFEEERRVRQAEFEKRIKLAEDEARARGLEEGFSQGKAQGQAEWLDQVARAKTVLDSLSAQHRDFAITLEEELVALVFAGVTRILGASSASLASVQEVVRRALAEESGRLIIRVAPDDFELLNTALKETSVDEIEVAPDLRVVLGGCILESDRGTLDARLETQIEQVRKALLAVRTPSAARTSA